MSDRDQALSDADAHLSLARSALNELYNDRSVREIGLLITKTRLRVSRVQKGTRR